MSERKGGGPGRLQGILRRSAGDVAAIRRQTAWLADATRELNAVLPPRLHGHWQVAALSTEALVITAESPAWSTPLRAQQAALLDAAAALMGKRPEKLTVRLATARQIPPRRAGQAMSPATADHLESAARGMDNPRLAASLRRLASRRRR